MSASRPPSAKSPPRRRREKRPRAEGAWRREGAPGAFTYRRADGKPLRSAPALRRIEALRIPPAWTDVRISPDAGAKVQATGTDAAGRKQYVYHPDHVAKGSRRKYRKLAPFARALPRIRQATARDLAGPGVGRRKVLATVVRLMGRGYFRVGSERYAVRNRTFGISTLCKHHLRIEGNDLVFRYVGKRGIDQRRVVADTPLVEVVREIVELPGKRLFQYVDEDGAVRPVTARDVNGYVKEVAGEAFTSKDFRTWGGTVRAAVVLAELGPARTEREARKNVALACRLVSTELGNTPAICRASYIHPAVLEGYLRGRTIEPLTRGEARPEEAGDPGAAYYPEEAALMRFLERRR